MEQKIIDHLNSLAGEGEPFLFVINYAGSDAYIRKLSEIAPDECLYDFEGITNADGQYCSASVRMPKWEVAEIPQRVIAGKNMRKYCRKCISRLNKVFFGSAIQASLLINSTRTDFAEQWKNGTAICRNNKD